MKSSAISRQSVSVVTRFKRGDIVGVGCMVDMLPALRGL